MQLQASAPLRRSSQELLVLLSPLRKSGELEETGDQTTSYRVKKYSSLHACFMEANKKDPHYQSYLHRHGELWVVWSPENLRNLLGSLLNLIHTGHGHPSVLNCSSKPSTQRGSKKKKLYSPILWIGKSLIVSTHTCPSSESLGSFYKKNDTKDRE